MNERELAEALGELLMGGLIEVDGTPVDDASPRLRPTDAGVAAMTDAGTEPERERPMLTIHLCTQTGERIHTALLPEPPDDEMPDVIVWGTRTFIVPGVNDDVPVEDLCYVEAVVLTLPSLRLAHDWRVALGRRS